MRNDEGVVPYNNTAHAAPTLLHPGSTKAPGCQFLIGKLQTKSAWLILQSTMEFQFLIGRLQTVKKQFVEDCERCFNPL